jgi:molybdopterin-guanine dinucleotide biosynthesis protein A
MPHDGGVTWAAVILTGGGARRLGGTDKASLEHRGQTLLDHALAAVEGAAETVVVGPEVVTRRPVTFARELPPGGGPLAGLAAGVEALAGDHERVVVLAVDMPHVGEDTIGRLLAAADVVDAAWLTDAGGRRQLAGVVRRSLVPAPEEAGGAAMRVLMTAGSIRDVAAVGAEADDIDTWDDLARLRGEEPPGVAAPRTCGSGPVSPDLGT